jgi:hypothetical protein
LKIPSYLYIKDEFVNILYILPESSIYGQPHCLAIRVAPPWEEPEEAIQGCQD